MIKLLYKLPGPSYGISKVVLELSIFLIQSELRNIGSSFRVINIPYTFFWSELWKAEVVLELSIFPIQSLGPSYGIIETSVGEPVFFIEYLGAIDKHLITYSPVSLIMGQRKSFNCCE